MVDFWFRMKSLGAEALMAVAYGALAQPGLLFQHYPPPLLPKPGKDNVRLRKLLKRTAKKKASAQVLQPVALFRSSLSPVNEASPDLELSDRSTPPKTPEAPLGLHDVRQPLRFSVRPLYQHVASPYPQREEVQDVQEESAECKTTIQEPTVKTSEVSKPKEIPKVVDTLCVAIAPPIPTIIVSRAPDTSGTTSTQETNTVSCRVAEKQEKMLIRETPKATPPPAEEKSLERQKAGTQVQEVAKPEAKPSEAKLPPAKRGDQDPLRAVRKLFGKDKVQESGPETKAATLPVTTSAVDTRGGEDKEKKVESTEKREGDESLPAEPLLKVTQKPKGLKSKVSGWARLKKHMVVEQEVPRFPEIGPQKEAPVPDRSEVQRAAEKAVDGTGAQDENQTKDAPVAAKMWNAVLFQMFSTKENIMHQIEMNKSEEAKEAKEEVQKDELKEIPSFAHRLPVLLFSPN
ncbi:hypothetical protein EYF80_040990 [Liparis tanakae]|uniref:Uncharacterized protein n=1 Tax=Liparis tanakae TaxID=230148 RepID=A0A4Z2G6T0_9TELE|nr:hypothetical protein EYF80_040990 [Liparis tanakae]